MFGQSVTGIEAVYWFCAIAGTAFFVLRMMFLLVGGFGHDLPSHDLAADVPHDLSGVDHGASDVSSQETEVGFKLLSLTSVSAFIMMFGWIGLSCQKDFGLSSGISLVLALLAGLLTMALTAYLFRLVMGFTHEGATFNLAEIVGQTAQVYHRIPANGKGRIQISTNGMLREIDAFAEDGAEIDSFTKVSVTKADGGTVYVRKLN